MIATLEKKGYTDPTEIQGKAIPLLLDNKVDIIAQAQTGTGKTAVFALPLIEKLDPGEDLVQAIILAPTRELVIQVCGEIDSLKEGSGLSTAAIYGGQRIDIQLRKLKEGVNIVVGTPGRVLDHIRRGTLVLDGIRYFILDEADEMLNMGFIEDIEEVLKKTPDDKRVLLFSATMPKKIKRLAERYMGEYTHIRSEQELTTDLTEQIYFEVRRKDKLQALVKILEIETDFYGIVFCRTKADVEDLATRLMEKGLKADNLHGDISQHLREKILGKFRDRRINILVATDVASRGIDVEDLTHVVNYSIPQDPEAYVHRIGRTGRAGKKGTAITFVTPTELRKMKFIQKFTNADIVKQKVPEDNEVMKFRKEKFESSIERILVEKETGSYRKWAKELLDDSSGEDLVTALLRYSFGKDRDGADTDLRWKDDMKDSRKSGKRSHEARGWADRSNTNTRDATDHQGKGHGTYEGNREKNKEVVTKRLSIDMGKKDGMTPSGIRDMINRKAGTDPGKIKDIEITDKRSFITVPSKDARSILKLFRRTMKGDAPLIRRAGSKKDDGRTGNKKKRYRKKKGKFVRS